jgi:MFS family permease
MVVLQGKSSFDDDTSTGLSAQNGEAQDTSLSWYILGLLTFTYALAYVDRQLLNLVVDPVKHTLGVSDTQFSFIQGAAFIFAYVAAAPLFGRLVDVTNRRNILIFGVCAWSGCTVLCGMADSFWELAIARFGVGVSEACVFPVAMSLIPELFSTRRLPRALSLFALGTQIGGGFSLLAGGAVIAFAATVALFIPALASLEVWQLSFVLIGLPGFLLAALLFSFREPARRGVAGKDRADPPWPTSKSLARIWKDRAFYGRIYLFNCGSGTVFLSIPAWYPTYLIRVHGMSPTNVGFTVGLITLAFGAAGTLFGPFLSQRLASRGYEDAPLRAAAMASVGSFLFCFAIPYAPSANVALAIIAGIIFCCAVPTSLVAFSLQRATPGRMRGTVASLYTLIGQSVGYGIGPTAIALITDHVFGDPLRIGSSLQIVCCVAAAVIITALVSNFGPYRRFIAAATGQAS